MKNNDNTQKTPSATTQVDSTSSVSSGQKPDSIPSDNRSEGLSEAQSPSVGDTTSETRDVVHQLQAAQSEHKPSADGVKDPSGSSDSALAGGNIPQTPELIPKSKSAKRSRAKKRDNHISVRLTDEELDVLDRYMNLTGKTQSESIRYMIRASEAKAGSIQIRPKTPPAQLEILLGELSKWRKEFSRARPRLNIPTPAADHERHSRVLEWRAESDRLISEIPKLEELAKLALRVMTSLTTARVNRLSKGYTTLGTWKKSFEDKGNKLLAAFMQDLIDILTDAGIKPKKTK